MNKKKTTTNNKLKSIKPKPTLKFSAPADPTPSTKSSSLDTQSLTNELILLSRDVAKSKSELKQVQESLKKAEKDKYELLKSVASKDTALDKLRKERDDLWAVVNTDKYRGLKQMEQQLEQVTRQKEAGDKELGKVREELGKAREEREGVIRDMEGKLEAMRAETGRVREKEEGQGRLLEVLEEKTRKQERELADNDKLMAGFKKDLD